MHSSETPPAAPATGADLLLQLGRLIVRARSASPSSRAAPAPPAPRDRLHAKPAKPSTSQQVQAQQKPKHDEPKTVVESQLSSHVLSLWTKKQPICIEVLLAPDCAECVSGLARPAEAAFGRHAGPQRRGLLLERWTMRAAEHRSERPMFITSQWLLNAIRSQLHFSQLAAWLARLKNTAKDEELGERRRKLSRELCNYMKLDKRNADNAESLNEDHHRKLNIVYSIYTLETPPDPRHEFVRPPTDHSFPTTDIGGNVYLNIVLQSLPRFEEIPTIKCTCPPKRRTSKDNLANVYDELTGKLNDLTLGPKCCKTESSADAGNSSRRLSVSNVALNQLAADAENADKTPRQDLLDDRMHTDCMENGKHRCSCDDESEGKENRRSSTSLSQDNAKSDERRLKEIAKYKRRLHKENKLKKLRDSSSSEGDTHQKTKETHSSIPILQAARFDRFKALGCLRNQTYLTLPASRMEGRCPLADMDSSSQPPQTKKTSSVSTQTEDAFCHCGTPLLVTCPGCANRGMVRSAGHYDLASADRTRDESAGRRKSEDDARVPKKHKCDKPNVSLMCDNIISLVDDSFTSDSSETPPTPPSGGRKNDGGSDTAVIKRPKLRRFFPIVDKIEKIVTDRFGQREAEVTARGATASGRQSCADRDESCVNADESCVNADESCVNGDEMCVKGNKSCVNGDERCVNADESCVNADESCVNGDEMCVKGNKSCVNGDERCVNADESCVNADESGVKGNKSSVNGDERCVKDNARVEEDYVLYEKCDYGTIDSCGSPGGAQNGFNFDLKRPPDAQVPSPTEVHKFRWRFDSAASMVFHTQTGLPLTSSPAPLRRGNTCFAFDDSINGIPGIKSALFHPAPAPPQSPPGAAPPSPASPASPASPPPLARRPLPTRRDSRKSRLKIGPSTGLLGSFEESALKGRLEPVATVHGFSAELGASGALCPPHRRLPVTVFFYAPGGTNAPYMGHINLGPGGYRVSRSGTVQVSLFNPHGTLVKMFVVLYDLTGMPPLARTFLRQRTLYMPAGAGERAPPPPQLVHKWLRYLIHLRFMTSKSGKLYLHTDIRIIVSRKADLDTATAHSAMFKSIANGSAEPTPAASESAPRGTDSQNSNSNSNRRTPNRVFGGCGEFDGYETETESGVSYELRSFTYGPDNPKYSPR